MAAKTRFFCIATAGDTTDGREISADWINQMAASYVPATYTARVNCEHLRGFSPEGPFNAYGDVVALEARDIEIELGGKKETRRALFAQIAPNDQLRAINAKGQKLFTSIEVNPAFAGTGKAYLVGLAVTDTPASLGCEMLQFAAGAGDKNPLASRKQDPANLFSAAGVHVLDLAEEAPAAPAVDAETSILAKVFSALGVKAPGAPAAPAPAPAPVVAPVVTPEAAAPAATPANDNSAQFTAALALLAGNQDATTAALAAMRNDFAALRTELAGEPAPGDQQRPRSTGTDNYARTDC